MPKPIIAVTGTNGQLGYELEQLSGKYTGEFDFLFLNRESLDLSKPSAVDDFFAQYQPAYFVNCAAYTAVDKAETDQETAYQVNAASVGSIARACHKHNTTLISISTDYVFNGQGTAPYPVSAPIEPVNYYGYTKSVGEKLATENNPKTIIIRTSWVYSAHGNNFVKTMLRLMKERPELKVVADQVGAPTYAADLAEAILQIIRSLEKKNIHYGIYHYSNQAVISWYDFAGTIRDMAGLTCTVHPCDTAGYPTPAKRPAYSVMDTSDIVRDFGIVIKDWKQSLSTCISRLLAG